MADAHWGMDHQKPQIYYTRVPDIGKNLLSTHAFGKYSLVPIQLRSRKGMTTGTSVVVVVIVIVVVGMYCCRLDHA